MIDQVLSGSQEPASAVAEGSQALSKVFSQTLSQQPATLTQ
jgi:hypothetical protein